MNATPVPRPFRLTLRAQIALTLGLLSLTLIGFGALTLFSLTTVRTQVEQTIEVEVARSQTASELAIATLQARRYEKDLLLNIGNPEQVAEYRGSWDDAFAAIQAALNRLDQLAVGDAEHVQIAGWRALADDYGVVIGGMLRQIESGAVATPEQANAALEPYKDSIRRLTNQALEARTRASAAAELGEKQLLQLLARTIPLVIGLGALGVLIALATVVLMPRQLTQPLRKLQTATEQLAGGNLDARVDVRGGNEIATLAAGFNQMAATIQQQILELDQTAVVQAQNEQLQQLLALVQRLENPVIGLSRDVLLVPLVGHIDARRAESISRSILDAVYSRKASIVLVDVTGLSELNDVAAKHLHELASGVRLLGARMIVTGMRAEIAMVLVQHDVSINFETLGQLQDGVSYVISSNRYAQN